MPADRPTPGSTPHDPTTHDQPTERRGLRLGDEILITGPSGLVHRVVCADSFAPGTLETALGGETLAAVMADPPYCSGGFSLAQKRAADKHFKSAGRYLAYDGDARSDLAFLWWANHWILEAHALAAPETYCFLWTDWRQLAPMSLALQCGQWLLRGLVVWDKGEGTRAPHKGFFRYQSEYVLWATAGALAARFEPDHPTQPGVLRCPVDRKKSHRHQKPVAVFEWLIEILHDRPGVVLDLFGGSLNALLACERLGRRAICLENNPAVLDQSLDRLRALGFEVSRDTPRQRFLWHLRRCKTKRLAAELAGIPRSTLYDWLKASADNDNDDFALRVERALEA